MSRTRLLRRALSTLRSARTGLAGGWPAASSAAAADAAHMHGGPPSLTAAAAAQQHRGLCAASAVMAGAKGGEAPPAAGGSAPPAGGSSGAAVAAVDELEDGEGDEEEGSADAMAEAFERLIHAAFEKAQQGKPMEAEYLLTEGAKQAEEILGKDALEVSALYDQLCLLQFLHERMDEAMESAKRALDILKQHDEGFGPASAIAATRYASTLLAAGSPEEAQLYTARSIDSLRKALKMLEEIQGDDEEEQQELEDTKAKFEIGLGESLYYHALSKQARDLLQPVVGKQLEEMLEGLRLVQRHLNEGSPIVAAALREHSRLAMAALEEDRREAAEALYVQDARLHMETGGNFEHVALTLYQCGTLQYVMGKYEEAVQSLEMALETMRQHYPDAEDHLLTLQQRLGMVQALLGRHELGKELLHAVAGPLVANLGESNPASDELEFMLCLISLREMEQDGVTDPDRRLECLTQMEKHLKALAAYGEQHMLVKKAGQLYAEAAAAAAPKQ